MANTKKAPGARSGGEFEKNINYNGAQYSEDEIPNKKRALWLFWLDWKILFIDWQNCNVVI